VMRNRRVRGAVWDWTVVVGNRVGYLSQVGRAMMVPFLSRLLTTTGVPDSEGVAAMSVSVDRSVSLLELDG
jgi:hypothetical protein